MRRHQRSPIQKCSFDALKRICFLTTIYFYSNACCILTSKAQATYEVFHINIF